MAGEDISTGLRGARKTILIVLFIPSVERDGATPVDQEHWKREALATFGRLFGGATAFPKASGVWRDDERGGALIYDEVVVLHSYVEEKNLLKPERGQDPLVELAAFCRRMGHETRQGEVGIVIDNRYLAFEPPFVDEADEEEEP